MSSNKNITCPHMFDEAVFLKTDARRPSELSHNAGLKKKVFYKLRCMQTPHVPLPGGELAPDSAATRPRRPCFKSCTSSQTLQ